MTNRSVVSTRVSCIQAGQHGVDMKEVVLPPHLYAELGKSKHGARSNPKSTLPAFCMTLVKGIWTDSGGIWTDSGGGRAGCRLLAARPGVLAGLLRLARSGDTAAADAAGGGTSEAQQASGLARRAALWNIGHLGSHGVRQNRPSSALPSAASRKTAHTLLFILFVRRFPKTVFRRDSQPGWALLEREAGAVRGPKTLIRDTDCCCRPLTGVPCLRPWATQGGGIMR